MPEELATRPARLEINAWSGGIVHSNIDVDRATRWSLRRTPVSPVKTLAAIPPDVRNWRDPRVGWGMILPMPAAGGDPALVEDQPQPIRDLYIARTVKGITPSIFRYDPGARDALTTLYNAASKNRVAIDGSGEGLGGALIPRYLLIYGSPAQIPWELQYSLNARCAVGRLDLTGDGLRHYVDALIADWKESRAKLTRVAIWSVDHRANEITTLMRDAIGARVARSFAADADIAADGTLTFVDGSAQAATAAALFDALAPVNGGGGPSVVVTTSHGLTDTSDRATLAARLGWLIDADERPVAPDALTRDWSPDGAIWYSHACCSAGGGDLSVYDDLVTDNSSLQHVLREITEVTKQAGACVAPLPRALLGAERPLRAFIGHVEPTFNWTLQASSGQYTTDALRYALYDQLYSGAPVGEAFRRWYERLATASSEFASARSAFNKGAPAVDALTRSQLANRDIRSLVILGDPTARLPIGT